jgi:hypothetical protein
MAFQIKNTGAKGAMLEGVTVRHALATDEQEFTTFASSSTLSVWKTDRDLKKIIPLYNTVCALANAYNGRYFLKEVADKKYPNKRRKKIITF